MQFPLKGQKKAHSKGPEQWGAKKKAALFLASYFLAKHDFHPGLFRDRGNGIDITVRIDGDFLADFLGRLLERDDQSAADGAENRQNQDHTEQLPFKF